MTTANLIAAAVDLPTIDLPGLDLAIANPDTAVVDLPGQPDANPVARWLAALRGGAYTQGHFYLLQNDDDTDVNRPAFCCLGVACEISGIGQWAELSESQFRQVYAYVVGDNDNPNPIPDISRDSPGSLPDGVRRQLGLRTDLGEFVATTEWLAGLYLIDPDVADKVDAYLSYPGTDAAPTTAPLPLALTLSGLNDDGGLTLSEIATIVDSNPPNLFAAVTAVTAAA